MKEEEIHVSMKPWDEDLLRKWAKICEPDSIEKMEVQLALSAEIARHAVQELRLLKAIRFAVQTGKLSVWDLMTIDKIMKGDEANDS